MTAITFWTSAIGTSGYRAVLVSSDRHRGHHLVEQAVLDTPQAALQWLDEHLAQYEFTALRPRLRRAILRRLRGDLRLRELWLHGEVSWPYVVQTETHTSQLEGRLCKVRTLPLLTPCLKLETVS